MRRAKKKPAARRPKARPVARRRAAAAPPAAASAAAIAATALASGDTQLVAAPAADAAPAAEAPSAGPLRLDASLSIREVGERVLQLKAWLAAGRSELDVSKLETIDTAGLQLLLAAAAAAQRSGARLRLIGGQRLLAGAAGALGLAEPLTAAAEILP